MKEFAIRINNLGKEYRIAKKQEPYFTFRDTLTSALVSPFRRAAKLLKGQATGAAELDKSFWALKDVSFEVKQGEVIGLIGPNGAGKSTLLKILTRITEPTNGYAEIHGRVGALLEVGTGFHQELTGRENVYLNGAILGMKKQEIDKKFDEMVDFSGVEKFIDTPVKHYSSGMHMRLAFAVAAHLEPEILLVDEVLAVGDVAFQKKCLGKMENVAKEGRTVLFVSHNLATVQALCNRGILLNNGRITADTSAHLAVRSYMTHFTETLAVPLAERTDREGDGRLKFTNFWLENCQGDRVSHAIIIGQDIRFCFAYLARESLRGVHIAFNLQESIGDPIINCNTEDVGQDYDKIPESGIFVCEIKKFPLQASRYIGNVFCRVQNSVCDWVRSAFVVEVEVGDFYGTGKLVNSAKVYVNQDWSIYPKTDLMKEKRLCVNDSSFIPRDK